MTKERIVLVAGALVLAAAAWLMLGDLGTAPLQLYDEGTYAQVVVESIERGDFMTFTYEGELFFDKPPLYFWLAGAASWFTDSSALMIRLPAAVAGVLLVAATMLLAYTLSRDAVTGVFAGALLVSIPPFIQGAREARLDVLVALFIVLGLYCFIRGKEHPRMYLWCGIAAALAVLSKSAIAVFLPAAMLSYAAWSRDWSWLRTPHVWCGAALGALVALPWHVYESFQHGADFWRSYLGFHILERYERNLFGDPALQTDYLARLHEQASFMLYTFFAAALAGAALWRRMPPHVQVALGAAGSIIAIMALVFFTAQTRALSYLIPLYPFAAMAISLVAHGLIAARRTS